MTAARQWRRAPASGLLIPSTFHGVPPARLKRALFAAEDLLVSIVRADDPLLKIEQGMVDGLNDELRARLKEVIEAALGEVEGNLDSLFSDVDLQNVLDAAGGTFSDGWEEAVGDDVGDAIGDAYDLGRDRIMATIGDPVVLDQIDELAQQALVKDTMFWIGGTWDNELGGQIADIIRQTVIENGLSRRAAGEALEQVFGDDFPDRASNYWQVVSSAGVVRGRTFGVLGSFQQAGVQTYRFRAVMDNRTSDVCAYLNGRIFQVADALAQRDAWFAADSPEAAKKVHPWPRLEDVEGMDNEELQAAGYLLPPLHGFCRSQIIPERFEGDKADDDAEPDDDAGAVDAGADDQDEADTDSD